MVLDNSLPTLLPKSELQLKQWSGDNPPYCTPRQEDAVKDELVRMQHEWFDFEYEDEDDAQWDEKIDAFFQDLRDTIANDLMADPTQEMSPEEAYKKIDQLFVQAGQSLSRGYALQDCLATMRKEDLLEIARVNHFHGYSKLRRQELIDFLEQNLLEPDSIRQQLATLTQLELDRLLELCLTNVPFISTETLRHATSALLYGLCYMDPLESVLTVPVELRPKIEAAVQDPLLTETVLLNDTIHTYCYGAVYLFGAYPVDKLLSHLQPEVSGHLDEKELMFLNASIFRGKEEYTFQGGYIVDIDLASPENAANLQALKQYQTHLKMDYWPDKDTLQRLAKSKWLIDKDLYDTFAKEVESFLVSPDYDIAQALRNMEYAIRSGCKFSELITFLSEKIFELPDLKTAERFAVNLQHIWNHTPMWLNGGLSPDAMRAAAKAPRKNSNVLSFAAHSKKKKAKKKSKKKK